MGKPSFYSELVDSGGASTSALAAIVSGASVTVNAHATIGGARENMRYGVCGRLGHRQNGYYLVI